MLTLDTDHPPKDKENHSLLFIPFGVPFNLSSTPPPPRTLKQNFCQFNLEPLLKAPNSELRAYEEVVRSKSKKSPTYTIQISKGNVRTSVSKIKRDLFAWLILFQPELKQEDKVIT